MPLNGDIRDIHGPVSLPGQWWQWALLVLLAVVILCFWWFWRKSRGKTIVRSGFSDPVTPCWEVALATLQQLGRHLPQDPEQQKEFYIRLTDIVRAYIELRFDLHAPEMTTEEFLQNLGSDDQIPSEGRQIIVQILQSADLVKFARHITSAQEAERLLTSAVCFVRLTVPGKDAAA